jgi:CRP-like cAMP-binding protein
VRASKGAEAYILPMSIFLSIVGKGVLFSQIEILEGLDDDQLRLLKSTVSLETHKKGIANFNSSCSFPYIFFSSSYGLTYTISGDIIFKEGDPGHSFYIILSGLVEISYDMSDTDPGLGDFNIMLGLGGWFGEEPLLLGGRQTSTATAASVMTLCRVPAETFNDHELFGPVHDRLKSDIDMSKVVNHARHFSRRISPTIFSTHPKKRRPTSFALSGAGNIGGSGWNRQLSRSPRNSLYGLTSMHLIIGNVFADLDGFSSMHPEDSPRLNTERSIGERRASAASVLTSNGSFVYPSRETSHTNANSITIADTFDMRVQHAFAIDSRRNSNESSSDGSILIRTPLSVSAKHRLVPRLEAVQCSKSDKSSWSTDLKDSIDITLKDGQSFVIVDQSDVRDILRNAEGQHTDPTSAIATRRCSHTSSGSSVVFTARSSDDDNDSSLYAGHEQVPVQLQVQLHGEGDREDGVVARNQTMASVKGEEEEIVIGELPGTKPRQGTEDTIKMEELSSSSGEASPSSSASSLSDDERTTDIRASDFVAAD